MIRIADTLPELVEALVAKLESDGELDLSGQVQNAVATKITFDVDADAAYLYVEPAADLNTVDKNVIGSRIVKTLEVSTPFWTILDIDNFDRLVGIEILEPGTLKKSLREYASA